MASVSGGARHSGAESTTTAEPVELMAGPVSLHRAVHARRAEYVRPHRMRIKIGTWNVAAAPGTDKDLASWFVSGKGLDRRLAGLDLAENPAIERQDTLDSLVEGDPAEEPLRMVGGDRVDLYVLGLQEVVDLSVTTQYVTRVYADPGPDPTDKWRMALEAALPEGYALVSSERLSGLLLLVYAAPDVAPTISNVSSVSVGTGLLGYMGNKGAVATRIVLGETTRMVFVNSHLASGSEAANLDRRCWDVAQILSRAQFAPVDHAGVLKDTPDKIGDEDFAFWFGDLNFRLDLPGEDIRRILTLHARGEYGADQKSAPQSLDGEGVIVMRNSESSDDHTDGGSSTTTHTTTTADQSADDSSASLPDPDDFLPDPSDDPASLQATLDSLLPHDQLRKLMRERKVLHDGWREGPVTFLPTYKYDVGTVGLFDSSEKHRAPSWCDRILFRTREDKEEHERKIKEEEDSRKRDEEMKARGIDHAGDDESVLFDYDPETDGDEQAPSDTSNIALEAYDEYDENEDETGELVAIPGTGGTVDRIEQEIYTSHQRVMSSDHKPVTTLLTIDYDAAVPTLKAKVHAEVARELDRAENEGRPGITIVADRRDSIDAHPAGGDEPKRSDESVDFGDVQFLKKQTTSLTLANTGSVSATFSFVETPSTDNTDGFTPPQWLTTSFLPSQSTKEDDDEPADLGKELTLEPGETVSALLEVLVDSVSHARMLNYGQATLEDVLILRVTDGRDHFIPVRAAWTPTCIGRSIEELIRVPDGGIRAFVRSQALAASIPYDRPVHWSAPKELFKLTEAAEMLTERVLADEQMLEDAKVPADRPGWPFEEGADVVVGRVVDTVRIAAVIDALDNDSAIAEAFSVETPSIERLEVVSRALLLFLRGLTDGIITIPIWARIEQASLATLSHQPAPTSPRMPSPDPSEEDDKATILDVLASAPNHNISFVFLTATLAKIIAELSPLSRTDLDALRAAAVSASASSSPSIGSSTGPAGVVDGFKWSLTGFRSRGPALSAETLAAVDRRAARVRKVAQVFGRAVCRAGPGLASAAGDAAHGNAKGKSGREREKEGKVIEERQRAVLELFLKRSREEGL